MQQLLYCKLTDPYIRECVSCILSFDIVFLRSLPTFISCLPFYHTVCSALLGPARLDSALSFLLRSGVDFFIVRIILWVFSLPSWYSFFSIPFPLLLYVLVKGAFVFTVCVCVWVYCTMHKHMCVCDRMRVIIPLMMGIRSFWGIKK